MRRFIILLPADPAAAFAWESAGPQPLSGPDLYSRPPAEPGDEWLALVPGDAAALHDTELPALAPAQAAAAARLLAAEVSAAPLDTVHVALGPPGDAGRWLALVDRRTMAAWLARLTAAGIDPMALVPAPVLLPAPDADTVIVLADDRRWPGQWLVKGPGLAFAAEADLATLIIGDRPRSLLTSAAFDAALAQAAPLLFDLRQGEFAPASAWRPDARRVRRLALLGAVLFAALIATDIADLVQLHRAGDRATAAAANRARRVLPPATIIDNPEAQVAARLAQLGGGRGGFTALTGPLLAALRNHPAAALQSLDYDAGRGLTASLSAPARADRDALVAALRGAGLDARRTAGPGDEALFDLSIRPAVAP